MNDAIAFNNAHANVEMPFFNQDIWDLMPRWQPGPNDPQPAFGGMTYNQALRPDHQFGVHGIDAALSQFNLDAVVTATDNPPWATDLIFGDHFIFGTSGLAAPEGYPIVQVPAAIVFGAPMGISFFGTAFSEPTLIKLASGFEAATQVRAHNLPTFAERCRPITFPAPRCIRRAACRQRTTAKARWPHRRAAGRDQQQEEHGGRTTCDYPRLLRRLGSTA